MTEIGEIFQIYVTTIDGKRHRMDYFDFGEAEAGIKTRKTFILKNITGGKVTNLEFVINDKSVDVVKAPKEFFSDEEKDIVMEVKPSISIKKGLKVAVQIKAKVIYLP